MNAPNPILETIAGLILEPDDEAFEQELYHLTTWIRAARREAQNDRFS